MGLYDDFQNDQDVIDNAQGVLSGEGFKDFETIQEKMTPGQNGGPSPGYTFSIHCIGCANKNAISVSWGEIVDLAAGTVPVDPDSRRPWIYTAVPGGGGKTTPPIACGHCAKQIFLYMTPDQCHRYVRAGIQAGAISEAQVAQRIQQIRQHQAAYQQQRR